MDELDIVILAIAALAALNSVAAARHWRGELWFHRLWERIGPYVGCYVRRSPATFVYAGIIVVTTWVVAGVGHRQAEALLRSQSTNLDNLGEHPVAVLFRSAFWSGGTTVLPVITLLAAVLAPAEVWLGTLRLIFVFAVGHVGATLITALALSQGALSTSGPTAHGTAGAVDVGVSYGLFCVAGVLTYRIPGPWRFLYAGVLVGVFAFFAFVVGRTFTDFGHFVTVLIGLAIYPLVRSRSVERRARIPLYRPWQDGLETAPSLSRVT
jgi:hypothetical protein